MLHVGLSNAFLPSVPIFYTITSWGTWHNEVLPAKATSLSMEHIFFQSATSLLQWARFLSSNWKAGPWRKAVAAHENTLSEKMMHSSVLMFNMIPWWPPIHIPGTSNLGDVGQQRELVKQMFFLFSKALPICSTIELFHCRVGLFEVKLAKNFVMK